MAEPIFHCDEASETLYVFFAPGEAATRMALHDHMRLRSTSAGPSDSPCLLTPFWLNQWKLGRAASRSQASYSSRMTSVLLWYWTCCATHRDVSCYPVRRTRRRWLTRGLLPRYNLCPMQVPSRRRAGRQVEREERMQLNRHSQSHHGIRGHPRRDSS
jgi:hypothetical protein